MDFFEHQEQARRNTGRLIFYFICAVIGIIAVTYLVAASVVTYAGNGHREIIHSQAYWHPELLLFITLFTCLTVGAGSLYKVMQLSGGGRAVAESLGGKLIHADTTDPNERKVLNVVEEMAIASGVTVPPVFLLEKEEGINAFAAGYRAEDAVIGITKGAVQTFTRDELQGVIAHEFSHILNGDMRLNIRLMGIIHGILLLGLIGYYLLRVGAFQGQSSRRNGAGSIALMGIGLVVVGSIGTLFGNIIKAAISRQREFLADASAVQFTRNPDGLADALKRIAGFKVGSSIRHPNAPEASHLFFGQALTSGFSALFATHPPIRERIRRIDIGWQPPLTERTSTQQTKPSSATASAFAGEESMPMHIGTPTQAHLSYAKTLLAALPPLLKEHAHEPYGARALIYGLLLSYEPAVRKKQLQRLAKHCSPDVYRATEKIIPALEKLAVEARLPLVDLTTPALRELSPAQYKAFRQNIQYLVEADTRLDLFEWTLEQILVRHLDPFFFKQQRRAAIYRNFDPVRQEIQILIASLAYLGHEELSQAEKAYYKATETLGSSSDPMPPPNSLRFSLLNQVLEKLDHLSPTRKRELLSACEVCVSADGKITVKEGELLRAISDALGCPMPPLLPGQTITQ